METWTCPGVVSPDLFGPEPDFDPAPLWRELVPAEYWDARLEKVGEDDRPILETWAYSLGDMPGDARVRGPNLVITGPVGVGKTYAGFAVLFPLYFRGVASQASSTGNFRGRSFEFIPFVRWMKMLKRDEAEARDLVLGAQILFLDDVGAAAPTSWAAEELLWILDERRADRRPIIATTNLAVAPPPGSKTSPLEEAIGSQSFSRLVHGSFVLRMSGEDRRKG